MSGLIRVIRSNGTVHCLNADRFFVKEGILHLVKDSGTIERPNIVALFNNGEWSQVDYCLTPTDSDQSPTSPQEAPNA